jgi:hypothetical protein
MNNVRPQLKLLNEEQIQQVHGYALRILSETGVRVDSPSVLERLEKTGQVQLRPERSEAQSKDFCAIAPRLRCTPSLRPVRGKNAPPLGEK